MDKPAKQLLNEAIRNARQAVKSKNPAAMNDAADELQRVMEQVGCTVDPNAQYRGSYSAGSPNNDAEDDAVDADFEEV